MCLLHLVPAYALGFVYTSFGGFQVNYHSRVGSLQLLTIYLASDCLLSNFI